MMSAFLINWLATVPTFAIPLLAASVGLIVAERAGVVSLGAEGYMAMGAMSAAVTVLTTGNLVLAIIAGIVGSTLLSVVFGIITILLRANQILAGLAIVALGVGITGVIGRPYVHQTFDGIDAVQVSDWIGSEGLVGKIFAQDPLVYTILSVTLACWWFIFRTRFGLRLRAVGEDPATADVGGVNVHAYQMIAVTICGALCGLSGVYLSLAASDVWVEGMVAGRGWIALSLVIVARWHPLRAVAGAFLFGAAEALLPRLQAVGFDAPVYLMATLPYVLTIFVLVASRSRSRLGAAPAGLGRPYLRQDRH